METLFQVVMSKEEMEALVVVELLMLPLQTILVIPLLLLLHKEVRVVKVLVLRDNKQVLGEVLWVLVEVHQRVLLVEVWELFMIFQEVM